MILASKTVQAGVLLLIAGCLLGTPGVSAAPPAYTYLFAALLAAITAVGFFRLGVPRHAYPGVALLLVFLAWNAFCAQTSFDDFASKMSLLNWMCFTTTTLAVLVSSQKRSDWPFMAGTMVIVACLISLFGIFTAGLGTALKATFTNPDCFSVLPLVALFLASGLAVEARSSHRGLWLACALFLLVAVALTGARAAVFGMVLGYLVLAILLYVRIPSSAPAIGLAATPVLLGLLALLAMAGTTTKMRKWEALVEGKDRVGIESRLDVVRHGVKAVGRSPLVGSGPGTFHLAYQEFRPDHSDNEAYMNVAHNDYMQVLVETGVPGLLLWLAVLGLGLWGAWACNQYPPGWCAAALGALTSVMGYSVFNFAVPVAADMIWVGALLGLCYALPLRRGGEGYSPAGRAANVLPLLLLLASLPAAHLAFRLVQQQRGEKQAQQLARSLDWDKAFDGLQLVSGLIPGNVDMLLREAVLCRRAYHFYGDRVWLERWADALKRARAASPRHLAAAIDTVHYLEFVGRFNDARTVLEEAYRYARYYPPLRRGLARNDILQGRYEEAIGKLKDIKFSRSAGDNEAQAELVLVIEKKQPGKGLEMLRRWSRADERQEKVAFVAAQIARQRGDRDTALTILEELVRRAPARTDYVFQLAELEGEMGLTQRQLTHLDQLRKLDLEGEQSRIARGAWQRWAELQMKQPKAPGLEQQLVNLLVDAPEENWARSILSQIYDKRGARAEARAILRDGINHDVDGRLRLELADLCMRHGHPEIARGYYEELLALSKNSEVIRARLKQATRAAATEESSLMNVGGRNSSPELRETR